MVIHIILRKIYILHAAATFWCGAEKYPGFLAEGIGDQHFPLLCITVKPQRSGLLWASAWQVTFGFFSASESFDWNLPRWPHVHLCLPKLHIPKVTVSWSLKVRNCEPLSLHWAMMSYHPVTMKTFRLSRNSLAVQNPFSFSAHFLLRSCPFPAEAGCYLRVHWHSAFHLRSDQKHLLMKQNEWIRENAGWLAGGMWSILLWLSVCCWITWETKERT